MRVPHAQQQKRYNTIKKMIPSINKPDLVILILLVGLTFFMEFFGSPYIQPVDLSNPLLRKPILPSIISSTLVLVLSFILPPILFLIYRLSNLPTFVIGLIQTNVLTLCSTNALKLLIGRPRPFFATACISYVEEGSFQCMGDMKLVNDARKSFPSGHSSLSFSAMVFLSLFIARKYLSLSYGGGMRLGVVCLICLPIIIAALVSSSRLIDFHHHYSDVIAGSLLGCFFAYISFTVHVGSLLGDKDSDIFMDHSPVSTSDPITTVSGDDSLQNIV